MFENCVNIENDKIQCQNKRSNQYGEYCYTCGLNGYRERCIKLQTNGKRCKNKVKLGKCCGHHIITKIFMEIETIEIHITNTLNFMDVESVNIVIFTKQEYEKIPKIIERCVMINDDETQCDRPKFEKYGDYCRRCGQYGKRRMCSGKLLNGENCPWKVIGGNFCGHHQNLRFQIERFMEIENIVITIFSKQEVEKEKEIEQMKEEIFKYREYILSLDEGQIKNRNNLLIIKYPKLIHEWDFVKNKGIDIKTITYGMNIRVYWICSENHSYDKTVYDKTSGTSCKECSLNSRRKHKKEEKEKVIQEHKSKPKGKSVEIGDATENFIVNLLSETGLYKSVSKIGHIGGSTDIEIIYKDNRVYFIQVKTLVLRSEDRESYVIRMSDNYDNNMLIVAVDKERKFFALTFVKDIPQYLALSFKCGTSKYEKIMYRDLNIFRNKLIELISLSCTKNLITNDTILKENKSLERFENFCKQKELKYERNFTNGNTVDSYINGYRIQHKFNSFPKENRNCYTVRSTKYGGTVNGIQVATPYVEGDFDFMVIEVSGIDNDHDKEKYLGNYCIIPSSILLEQHILETSEYIGKTGFSICPPDFEKNHWAKSYWNNISHF